MAGYCGVALVCNLFLLMAEDDTKGDVIIRFMSMGLMALFIYALSSMGFWN